VARSFWIAIRAIAALAAIALGFGCAQHAMVICRPLELVSGGQYSRAVQALDKTSIADSPLDKFLYHVQRGHLFHLAGEYEESNREFEAAVAVAEELEPFSLTETVTDYTLNEASKAYQGEDYERAYVHYYMALNYLAMDDLEEALVECRRVDQVFRELDARYEEGTGRYQDDGFIRYLSGLIYEARGEYDEAFIDYRKAVLAYRGDMGTETGVEAPSGLLHSLVCVGRRLGREADVAALAVPIVEARVPDEYRGRLDLEAVIKIAVPELESVPSDDAGFIVTAVDTAASCSPAVALAERAQDMDALARWALERRLPALIARSAIRTTLKTIALLKAQDAREEERKKKEEAGEERGWLSRLVDFAVDHVAPIVVGETEQADTRGWITLPSRIWVARLEVEPGNYEVTVEPESGSSPSSGDLSLGTVSVGRGEFVFRSCRELDRPHPMRCEES
jgi:tetratricopeptide (TPR) repeat protein